MPSYWLSIFFGSGSSTEIEDNSSPVKIMEQVVKVTDARNTAATEKKAVIDDESRIQAGKKKAYFNGVRAIGLSKSYKSIVGKKTINALQNVYFEVQKGELLGIMGHNGAGKSTLINVLCGLVNRDDGNARIFDYNIER